MGREHWVEIELGKILETTSGGTPSRSNSNFYKGNIPWLKSGELNDGIITNSEEFISEEAIGKSSAKLFPKGTILIALYGATLGKLGILGIPSATNQAICAIFSSKNINDKYIFSFLFSERDNLIKAGFGAAQPNISQLTIRSIKVPLPPLAEQQRIVEKLDAILPRVKAAKARLEKMPKILKRFRQSVLAAACSGKLTEDWREKHPQIITDLNIPEVKNHDFDIPEGWRILYLKDIAKSMSTGPFGSMLHSYDYIKGGSPVINPTNIVDYRIIPDYKTSIDQTKSQELSRYQLKVNDIILSRRGDLSKCAIVTKSEENWIAGTGLFILRANINPIFFRYIFQMDYIQEKLNQNAIGSTMVNLNQKILGSLLIPMPTSDEQLEIVHRVEKLFALADSLEAKYKKAMQRIEKIEQSVLAKAFRGELAAQDPNDEPAEVLLQRILAEKSLQLKQGKTKKTLKYPIKEQPEQIAAEGNIGYKRKGKQKN